MDKAKITVREIALFGMLGALAFGLKVAMSYLPNIEPVSLLVMTMTTKINQALVVATPVPAIAAITVHPAIAAHLLNLQITGVF